MSKVKEQMMQEQEQEFELELSYKEWLRDNISEPTSSELDEMEQDYLQKQSHFGKNRIITQQPLNNTNYYPMKKLL